MSETMGSGTLAFMGDAVYELLVRERLIRSGITDSDRLHFKTVYYVRAESQAYAVKKLLEGFLSEEEVEIVKKARNHKMPNRSRSAGMVEYKLATGLEALVGKLYLDENKMRLEEVMTKTIELLDEKASEETKKEAKTQEE